MGLWKDFLNVMAYKQKWDWFSWQFFFAPLSLLLPLFCLGVKKLHWSYLTLFMLPVSALFLATTIGRMMAMSAPVLIVGSVFGAMYLASHAPKTKILLYFGIVSIQMMNLRSPWVMLALCVLPFIVEVFFRKEKVEA